MRAVARARRVLGTAMCIALVCAVAAPATAQAGWRALSNKLAGVTITPALYRDPAGTLHVVTVDDGTANGADQRLVHYSIAPNGTMSSTYTDILGQWVRIFNPALLPDEAGMRVYFGGQRTFQSTDPFSTTMISTAASADGGRTWALDPAKSNFTGKHVDDLAATIDPMGAPVLAWSTIAGTFVHLGFGPAAPTTEFINTDTCCGYSPNVGVDRPTGVTWLAFRSNEPNRNRIWLRPVAPGKPGVRYSLPQSQGSEVNGPVPLAVQNGGARKLWVAWCARTRPGCTKVSVLRVADKKRVDVATVRGAKRVGMTAGAGGRLWVWWSKNDGYIYYTRSNPAVTTFARPRRVPVLAGSTGFWRVDGAAAGATKLDLLVSFTQRQTTKLYHQRVTAPS